MGRIYPDFINKDFGFDLTTTAHTPTSDQVCDKGPSLRHQSTTTLPQVLEEFIEFDIEGMSDVEMSELRPAELRSLLSDSPGRLDMHMRFTLVDAERKFRRACEQIVVLNSQLQGLQNRYDRAKADNARAFRYSLRLRLAVVEGMRNMYYDYAHCQAIQVTKLRTDIYASDNDHLPHSDDDDDVVDLI